MNGSDIVKLLTRFYSWAMSLCNGEVRRDKTCDAIAQEWKLHRQSQIYRRSPLQVSVVRLVVGKELVVRVQSVRVLAEHP